MVEALQVKIIEDVLNNVEKVVIGKRLVIEKMIVAMLAGGHVLFEDVPGVGKTLLVKALSRCIGVDFKRIQFTPDLLPTDIIGVSIYNQKTQEFEFKAGPITTNILLADEINRTSPKCQSALLEAMEEKTITVDGWTRRLERPFMVMATQNPVEYEGTYPLPEAQMDRFMLKLHLGYPDKASEMEMLSRVDLTSHIDQLEPVCTVDQIIELQESVRRVFVDELVKEYIVDICRRTRAHKDVLLGVSPRGTVALYRVAQAHAFIRGRDYVLPDDVKVLTADTLAHRLILQSEARMDGIDSRDVLKDISESISVPIARNGKDQR